MSPTVKLNPDIDPLENDLKRPIQSWESTTPALERRKYFTVVVHHSPEIDLIGAFRNGATAIEFIGTNESKSRKRCWEWVILV
jgi:hypothetical protein